jgi:hypothetical protein
MIIHIINIITNNITNTSNTTTHTNTNNTTNTIAILMNYMILDSFILYHNTLCNTVY